MAHITTSDPSCFLLCDIVTRQKTRINKTASNCFITGWTSHFNLQQKNYIIFTDFNLYKQEPS